MKEEAKIIISGGGTGGHIFPAVAIANAIKRNYPKTHILFIGAQHRMEMQRIPAAGYEIKGLPISGFDRKHLWHNVMVLGKLLKSLWIAHTVIRKFKPDVVVGVGGFASGPTLKVASWMHIPTLLQEQNSYAGVTNKLLAKKAATICVAYKGMEKFFSPNKIVLTGNPVRKELLLNALSKEEARREYHFDLSRPMVLLVGGSLGARSLNNCMMRNLQKMKNSNVQFLWQCGQIYYEEAKKALEKAGMPDNILLTDFISDMNTAYSAADLVISRAGAGSISEFCLLGKPTILVPSPNVAEDHQTKNAMALVSKGAALYVKDNEIDKKLIDLAILTVGQNDTLRRLSNNIKEMAFLQSDEKIAQEVFKLLK